MEREGMGILDVIFLMFYVVKMITVMECWSVWKSEFGVSGAFG